MMLLSASLVYTSISSCFQIAMHVFWFPIIGCCRILQLISNIGIDLIRNKKRKSTNPFSNVLIIVFCLFFSFLNKYYQYIYFYCSSDLFLTNSRKTRTNIQRTTRSSVTWNRYKTLKTANICVRDDEGWQLKRT